MNKLTIKTQGNFNHLIFNILVLLVLVNFSSSLLALSSNQVKDKLNSENLFSHESYLFNENHSTNGTDVIFESSFEPVPILSLSANPTNINSGGLSIITWDLAESAISCVKSGAWSGSLTGDNVSNGSHNEVVDNITVSSTYSLQCTNSFGNSPIRSVDVFVDVKAAPIVNLTSTANGTNSATLNWTLQNDAVFCQKTGLWSGLIQGNPTLPNNVTMSENVFENGVYTLECSNSFGSDTDSTTVSNIINVVPPVLTLSANPTTVNSGGSSELTWMISNSPTQCIKSGDWPTTGNMTAQEITNGVHFIDIINVTSSKSFSLTCINAAGSSGLKTVTVTVSVAGGATWPSCSGASASILGGNEDRSILAQGGPGGAPTNYTGLFSDIYNNNGTNAQFLWPGILGASISLNIEKNHYIAAQFKTSNMAIDAQFLSTVPSNNQGVPPQAYTISISECPGDFNVHLNQPACKFNFESFKWSTTTNPPGPDGFFCELEQNKTYYLNIVHSNNSENDNYATSDCLSQNNSCGHLSAQALINLRSPEGG